MPADPATPLPPAAPDLLGIKPLTFVLTVIGVIASLGLLLFGTCVYFYIVDSAPSAPILFRIHADVDNAADRPLELIATWDGSGTHQAPVGASSFTIHVYDRGSSYDLGMVLYEFNDDGLDLHELDEQVVAFLNDDAVDLRVDIRILANTTLEVDPPMI